MAKAPVMDEVLRYRGRIVRSSDVTFIRELVDANADSTRRQLSTKLCEAWNWRQANGAFRDMVCRGLMLALDRAGHIKLPAIRMRPPNPLATHARPSTVQVDQSPIACALVEVGPLTFLQVRRSAEEKLFGGLLQTHHYLGYTQPVGEHLKFLVKAAGRPIACFAWSSAPRHIGPRDRFIGWNQAVRRAHVHLLAYNTRFLVVPWVRVPHLASHLLGRMTRMLSSEWERVYRHPVHYAETFVDPERFQGTCYLAANWQMLGITTGRGKNDQTGVANRSKKHVLGLPLVRDFRRRLGVAP